MQAAQLLRATLYSLLPGNPKWSEQGDMPRYSGRDDELGGSTEDSLALAGAESRPTAADRRAGVRHHHELLGPQGERNYGDEGK